MGYFIKRLKDNGYVVWKMFNKYSLGDKRRWTVLVNPGYHSLYITCSVDEERLNNTPAFRFDDGGWSLKTPVILSTKSMEVIINLLNEHGILPDSTLYRKEYEVNK